MRLPALLLLLSIVPSTYAQGVTLCCGVVTRTDVDTYSSLALDIRDIQEQLLFNNTDAAINLYLNGRNAEIKPGIKLSIHDLSKNLAVKDAKESTPNFIYHLWGLSGGVLAQVNENNLYADNYAQSALASKPKYATDGMVALNMWMYATHLLYKGVDTCSKLTVADNPNAFDLGGGGMDEFIAIWIGDKQEGASDNGYGLYAMAQKAGDLFGTTSPQAQVNTNLILLYQEGAAALSFPSACSSKNSNTVGQLWVIVQQMTSQMYIPLIQLLIDALFRQDVRGTRLYATAIVPQISQCKPSLFKRLKESLLSGTTAKFSQTTQIIRDLQEAYDCFGFTCADVGSYMVDQVPACAEIPDALPLAEYVPTSFVHNVSMNN